MAKKIEKYSVNDVINFVTDGSVFDMPDLVVGKTGLPSGDIAGLDLPTTPAVVTPPSIGDEHDMTGPSLSETEAAVLNIHMKMPDVALQPDQSGDFWGDLHIDVFDFKSETESHGHASPAVEKGAANIWRNASTPEPVETPSAQPDHVSPHSFGDVVFARDSYPSDLDAFDFKSETESHDHASPAIEMEAANIWRTPSTPKLVETPSEQPDQISPHWVDEPVIACDDYPHWMGEVVIACEDYPPPLDVFAM